MTHPLRFTNGFHMTFLCTTIDSQYVFLAPYSVSLMVRMIHTESPVHACSEEEQGVMMEANNKYLYYLSPSHQHPLKAV